MLEQYSRKIKCKFTNLRVDLSFGVAFLTQTVLEEAWFQEDGSIRFTFLTGDEAERMPTCFQI